MCCRAQSISGTVTEESTGKLIRDVSIENTFSGSAVISDSLGRFSITAHSGELVVFRKLGYRVGRIRVPQGAVPPFFKVVLAQGPYELAGVVVTDKFRSYKADSVRNHEIYKAALEFPELTGLDVIRHPFSALSKTNRQKWAFQKEYAVFEQMKYVDYTFNDRIITAVTGLRGDSLRAYQQSYRPAYEQLRGWQEYEFLQYIRRTTTDFRRNAGAIMNRIAVPEGP